ncbi:putative secretory lipase [Colletotrichum truncatum]|uniref:Secretory lipase n=1 Tax=Colletotrichum truncatum TaxID=5467 RepID=A0ACC3Z8Z7_COLTU|nr:putative secretory lipase [Colletotrichum truncatum]KAF6780558.1 putative secretory lipase [Colletotrichum truncatum]
MIGYRSLILNLLLISGVTAVDFRDNCNAECEAAFREALVVDTRNWVNVDVTLDSFYSNPPNISDYSVGDLVKWQDITGTQAARIWAIPAGMSLSRFFYMSEDIDGKPIPATAFALIPWSNPQGNDKPFRTLVWTHGTAGYTRQCAPTNHRSLYYEWEGPFALAQAGYAVIAPDYAGQGSDIPQGFMYESGALHAADVSHGLQAARKALGDRLSKEWVVIGHSEGGLSAWRTNEREAKEGKAAGGFLGAVSVAPALRPLSLIPESFRRANGGPVGDVVSVYLLQSISKLYKSIRVEDYVSDIVASLIPLSNQGCLRTGGVVFGKFTEEQLYKNTSWLTHPDVVDWQNRFNGVGAHALAAPMLVVQGVNDTLTYSHTMEEDLEATCKEYPDSAAELLLYPELDHDPAFQAAQVDYLPWIADRFNNVPVKRGCTKRTVGPATKHFSITQQSWEGIVQGG